MKNYTNIDYPLYDIIGVVYSNELLIRVDFCDKERYKYLFPLNNKDEIIYKIVETNICRMSGKALNTSIKVEPFMYIKGIKNYLRPQEYSPPYYIDYKEDLFLSIIHNVCEIENSYGMAEFLTENDLVEITKFFHIKEESTMCFYTKEYLDNKEEQERINILTKDSKVSIKLELKKRMLLSKSAEEFITYLNAYEKFINNHPIAYDLVI